MYVVDLDYGHIEYLPYDLINYCRYTYVEYLYIDFKKDCMVLDNFIDFKVGVF